MYARCSDYMDNIEPDALMDGCLEKMWEMNTNSDLILCFGFFFEQMLIIYCYYLFFSRKLNQNSEMKNY